MPTMWVLLFTAVLAAPAEFQLSTLDGRTVAGRLEQLSADEVTLETPAGAQAFAVKDLLDLSTQAPQAPTQPKPAATILLVDGSMLLASGYGVAGGKVRAELLGGGTAEMPTSAVQSVRFGQQDPKFAQQWSQIASGKHASDVLVIQRPEALDFMEGVLGDSTADTIDFTLDGEKVPVKRTRIAGLIYYHPQGRSLPEPRAAVTDSAGSTIQAASLSLTEGQVRIATPAGLELTRPLDRIARIDFSLGKIVYLADLAPESSIWTPYFASANMAKSLATFYRPRGNRGLESAELMLGGKTYRRGLALHSRSELDYRLPGEFSRLLAVAGIDDRVRPGGNVRLVIRGDGRVLFDETIRGADEPRPLEIDIAGVKRLQIVVDYGEDLDVGDHLDLCEARMVK